ncbi:hypothetical protein EON67_08240 [archaeon]|nr:MAG: hypothetical protein EON67_08240 [archaeon]
MCVCVCVCVHACALQDWPDNVAFYNGTDSGGECGVSTTTRYPMVLPAGASDPLRNGWYTVTHGPMTTIMLNSELPVDPSSAQYAYLQSALAAVNRTITPWLFVAFHRPMYYGGVRDPNFGQFESLLMQYKVDIVFTGHEHYAQVTCPVYRSQCVSAPAGQYDAPVHVIIGNAGMSLTPSSPDPMLRYQNSEYGYSTLHIKSAQHLEMNFYADDTNALHYTLTLDRTYPRSA